MITESKKLPPSLSFIPPQLDICRHLVFTYLLSSAQIQTVMVNVRVSQKFPFWTRTDPDWQPCVKRVGRGVKYPLFAISICTEGSKMPLGSERQGQTDWRTRKVRLELVDGKELISINSKSRCPWLTLSILHIPTAVCMGQCNHFKKRLGDEWRLLKI